MLGPLADPCGNFQCIHLDDGHQYLSLRLSLPAIGSFCQSLLSGYGSREEVDDIKDRRVQTYGCP
jgi:hypothetical protein